MSIKRRTVWVAIGISLALTIVKAGVGFLTMSIAVLSSALDSFMDVCSMLINLAAVRTAEMPADDSHPFGHGKAEAIAGLFQATFIAASAGFLIVQAFHRMIDGYRLEDEMVGVAIMVIAIIASIFVARLMKRVGDETQSSAISAGALNYGADVWTSIGVLVALGLERFLSVKNADPVISIAISIYIGTSAIRIARDSITQLMDKALPDDVLKSIDRCINGKSGLVRGYHHLRTRSVGGEKYIEFHLEIDRNASFEDAHEITEQIIADISRTVPGARLTVHSDPV